MSTFKIERWSGSLTCVRRYVGQCARDSEVVERWARRTGWPYTQEGELAVAFGTAWSNRQSVLSGNLRPGLSAGPHGKRQ